MKNLYDKIGLYTLVIVSLQMIFINLIHSQSFQKVYGTNFDNSFTKVIEDGTHYFVLGQDETVEGQTKRATVSRLDANGSHLWTLSLETGSIWNDAVLVSPGELIVVGSTLPFDATTQSIIGRISTSAGVPSRG